MTAPSPELAAQLGLARLDYHVRVTSTMDVAHALAEDGAPAGTLVLASAQASGRGRSGKAWASEPEAGLWCTLIERPEDTRALDVLALRVGLQLAVALEPSVDAPVRLKWPNDLFVGDRKLGGILIEVRWREAKPEWVAIGVGINRTAPASYPEVAHVRTGITRDALLAQVVPALRRAASAHGPLGGEDCAAWAARDLAVGRRVTSPADGIVHGITPQGAVLIETAHGAIACQSGSLLFA
ncbi:biotin--[acetyl-CoA-carboxylase] ligase [Gemmatimonas sp.]|jgi:BirA family biotin operon repressor/biotin-[acetyl-CoA-carboxylase] ligase|uniref:biotin--[acetyl-CoA-carboxylase] ligase n=1 Tax=Gemmatimonas sp. TaxID=1962908 RepID=UPI00391DD5F9